MSRVLGARPRKPSTRASRRRASSAQFSARQGGGRSGHAPSRRSSKRSLAGRMTGTCEDRHLWVACATAGELVLNSFRPGLAGSPVLAFGRR